MDTQKKIIHYSCVGKKVEIEDAFLLFLHKQRNLQFIYRERKSVREKKKNVNKKTQAKAPWRFEKEIPSLR